MKSVPFISRPALLHSSEALLCTESPRLQRWHWRLLSLSLLKVLDQAEVT